MAAIPNDVAKRINDMYNQQKTNELGQLRTEQQKATQAINTQKKETGQQYYDKRNQADVVNFQNRRGLQEMMAASGLGRSGENISGQVALQASRQNTLGGLNRDEQGILNSLTQQMKEINDPSRANQITAAIESQRAAALAEALERAIARQHEIDMFNRQQAAINSRSRSGGGGGGSRRSGSSGYSSGGGKDKSLADLYREYQENGGKTNLNILEKRSSVPTRQRAKSIGELLAEQKQNAGGGGGRIWLSPN
jgi:hypothetical protein